MLFKAVRADSFHFGKFLDQIDSDGKENGVKNRLRRFELMIEKEMSFYMSKCLQCLEEILFIACFIEFSTFLFV